MLERYTRGFGSVWDIALPIDLEKKYLFIADGTNNEIHIVRHENGEKLSSFGHASRAAGQFQWLHTMAIDSHGSLFTGDGDTGKHVQKFIRDGGTGAISGALRRIGQGAQLAFLIVRLIRKRGATHQFRHR